METAEEIADVVWTYVTRTLLAGTADAPTTPAEARADDVWTYSPRTLTGGPPAESTGANFPRWRSMRR